MKATQAITRCTAHASGWDPLPSFLRGKQQLCVLQTVDPPNHVLTPNSAPALPSALHGGGEVMAPCSHSRRGVGETAPSRDHNFRDPSAVLPLWPCEWPSALRWKRSKGFKEFGASESILALLPPLTLPMQKLSHPFNSTLSVRRALSVRWQVE